MEVTKTKFNGLLVFKKKYFTDARGYFLELYKSKIIRKRFPFTCISLSKKNVDSRIAFPGLKRLTRLTSTLI